MYKTPLFLKKAPSRIFKGEDLSFEMPGAELSTLNHTLWNIA